VAIHKLTALAIERARRKGRLCDGGNLYLDISKNATKTWLFRYKVQGRTKFIGLGSLANGVSITQAREIAASYRKLLREGHDPILSRRQERAAAVLEAAKTISFDQAAASYMDAHRAGWRSRRHPQQIENGLRTYTSPVFGTLPVAAIDTGMVMKVIEPLWFTRPGRKSPTRRDRKRAGLGKGARLSRRR
jgi:hypothetical protein